MTNDKSDRRCAPVYDPAIDAPVLRLPAISHEDVLAILADRPIRATVRALGSIVDRKEMQS
jgi:hypothetical protein